MRFHETNSGIFSPHAVAYDLANVLGRAMDKQFAIITGLLYFSGTSISQPSLVTSQIR